MADTDLPPLTGWNTDRRRNFALLEALKWGADLIVSVDDDMIPMNWQCEGGGGGVRPEDCFIPSPTMDFISAACSNGSMLVACFLTHLTQRGLPPERNIITDHDFHDQRKDRRFCKE